MVVLPIAVVTYSGCATVKNPPGTVAVRFVQNPDRVWEGIQLSLETLDYVVESSNRDEGTIRAAKPAEDGKPGVALEINQIMYTDDQVDVYVRGAARDSSNAPVQEILDAAAQDFVAVLERKLGR
jgi:hypothetical protein